MPNEKDEINNELLLEAAVHRAAKLVTRELSKREEQRSKRITLIFSILALIGFGGVSGVIAIQIESAVKDAVKLEVKNLEPIIDEKASYFVEYNIGEVREVLKQNELADEFVELTRSLDAESDGFSNELRDSIVEILESISDVKRLTSQQRVQNGLDIVVKNFRAAGLGTELDKVDDLIGHVLVQQEVSTRTLADHYGELIMGSPHGIEALADEVNRIEKYLAFSDSLGYPEQKLLWEMFIELKANNFKQSVTLTKMNESIMDLNDLDRLQLYSDFETYSDSSNWQIRETQEGRELERSVALLREFFPDTIGGASSI